MEELKSGHTIAITHNETGVICVTDDIRRRIFEISSYHLDLIEDGSARGRFFKKLLEHENYSIEDNDLRINEALVFDMEKISKDELQLLYGFLLNNPSRSVILLNDVSEPRESINKIVAHKPMLLRLLEFPNVRQLRLKLREDSHPLNKIIKHLFDHQKDSYNSFLRSRGREVAFLPVQGYFVDYFHLFRVTDEFRDRSILYKIERFARCAGLSVVLTVDKEGLNYMIHIAKHLKNIGLSDYGLCRFSDCKWLDIPVYSGSYSAIKHMMDEDSVRIGRFQKISAIR